MSAHPVSEIHQDTLELLEWPRLAEHLAGFASTAAGRRHCAGLGLPDHPADSRRLLLETTELLALDGLCEGGLSLQGAGDIAATVAFCAKGGCAGGEELLAVAATLATARRLRRQIDDPELRPITTALVAELRTLPELEQRLHFCLEEGGRVADRASGPLEAVRRQLLGLRSERRERLQDLVRRYASLLQDTVVSERSGRPVLAVKAGAAAQVSGLVHDSSASGSTVYVEPQAVIPLGNRIRDAEAQERELERQVRSELSALVGEQADALGHLQLVLVRIDAGLARARYGQWLGAVRPELAETADAPFELRDLRHPLLLWQERREGGQPVVPVSISVGRELRVVAITGPNTGGKTVTLKSLGLAALMARAGLFLPCAGTPRLPWCGQVLADIGDEQSLQQNLSTFSGHIRRIARILVALGEGGGLAEGPAAMVLLDEVGAGTDPTEGSALAAALLRHLADRARLTVATTHFGELKALKYVDSRFENASVAFDVETLSPTYRLQWGIPGRSNALAIASRLGLDPEVLAAAAAQLEPGGEGDVNRVIEGLEQERQRQQEAAEAAAVLLARTELLHEELLQRWSQQKEQSAELQEQRRQRLELSIREGQGEVRRLIRRLRAVGQEVRVGGRTAGETARQAGQRLRLLQQQHRPLPERREHGGWRPKVGDRIRLLALGKAAEVLAISEEGSELTVRCGVLRLTVELAGIEGLHGEKPAPPEPPPQVRIRSRRSPGSRGPEVRTEGNTVDVRGLRVHEAEAAVEERLRGANGPVWVIHGIGTGKLKRGLREWLSGLAWVERVSDAEQGDGGPGCSVIWVK
ncbi:endonuclease MutS2 [Cyanobium sp. AMD-g]|uniref:endonuclease MutS2 n=1 Tax=Cyanobium sp. AMD-g TaxID=2823699 RepID=UPI0020CD1307|nr:endonuclease MutS2 [Cyanobium sp. AMD-g]MCP9931994.1 endonuclease MutS2 [Cyanobium sp. AMD-g]